MSERVAVIWDEALLDYNFGPAHPLAPVRVDLAMRLSRAFGLLDHAHVRVEPPAPLVDDAILERIHESDYIAAVRRASADIFAVDATHGLGSADIPTFAGMHEASARVCSATLRAAQLVASGDVQHAVNLAGGLHHAMPDQAAGFCVYNDIAVGIMHLLDAGFERIAYIDVDVHHGDGVQTLFWNDPRVLTLSLHENPRSLWPGTGLPTEIGGPDARGTAVNVALPAGTSDEGWLMAFHAIVPDILTAFQPQVIVSQHGCDSHAEDPLAHLALSIDGQRMSYEAIHRFAHQHCDGRWVAVGGGGYELVEVVPRIWTHLIAEAADRRIPPSTEIPSDYRDYVTQRLGRPSPGRMTDGRDPYVRAFEAAYSPDDVVTQAILATREAVYPHWGLVADPYGFF